jgi:hypothetical protein
MIIKIKLFEFLESIYPRDLAEEWDRIGLLVDNSKSSYSLIIRTDLSSFSSNVSSDFVMLPPIENPVSVPSRTFSQVSCAPFETYAETYTPL